MTWISAAFTATLLFTFCVILDKFINTGKLKSVYSFAILLNIVYFPFILVTSFLLRSTFVFNISFFYSFLAGTCWFVMWLFYWKALQKGEASRVAALFFTQPIYAALIGVIFLHETLGIIKWLGIVIIVAGAILSSLGGNKQKKSASAAYIFALLAALLSALGNSISKVAMTDLPPLLVNCIGFYTTIPFYILLMKDKTVRDEVQISLKKAPLMIQMGLRGLLGYVAIMLNMIAMGLGTISLVSAIAGSQPIFVLVISLALSYFFPKIIHEELGKKALIPKLFAILLTVSGVILISL